LKVDYIEETSVRKALAFELEAETVDQEIEKRTQELARNVKLPGFRAGKVPPKVIKQRFREQLLEEVAETLVNRVVFPELDGRALRPLATPQISDMNIRENEPMTFRAVFETLPIVEVPEYRGLAVKTREARPSDEDLDREIERMREEAARFDPVEGRPAQAGDFVLLDIAWRSKDAEPGRDENALLEIGSSENHPDLNTTLEGMSSGETREVQIEYATDYPKKGLAGRALDHTLTLKAIKQKVLPAIDDELAKDLGEFEDLAALREAIRKQLFANEEAKIARELKNALVDALVEKASFEVPEALMERHMSARTENVARSLAFQGVDPSKVGMDWAKYRESQREDSIKAARADILLDEIARREKIEVLDAEIDAEIERYAEGVKKSKQAARAQLEKDGELASVKARLRETKTLDLLKANARLDFE